MSEHYFVNRPASEHDRKEFTFTLRGKDYRFVTDAGVFSRERVDFGTRLLIETMEIPKDARVLDMGCGYGPIGIVAADLAREGSALLVDINERAVELAERNIALNGIANAQALVSDLYANVPDERFDRILTNPPIRAGKSVVQAIFCEGFSRLSPGGELWVVIQKKQGAPSAYAKLLEIFGRVDEIAKKKGYRVFRAVKEKV
ncbi:class I SAM-dependent methyltransferase [Bacillaceae bacterium]